MVMISGGGLSGYEQDRPVERLTLRDVGEFLAGLAVLVVAVPLLWICLPLMWLVGLVDWRLIKEIWFSG